MKTLAPWLIGFVFSSLSVAAATNDTSHRDGPIFLNVLRVLEIPEALGLLAPRRLTIYTSNRAAFADTRKIYDLAGGTLRFHPLP